MRKLIKRWDFIEEERTRIILGNGVRLNPGHYLELDSDASGYLTDANLTAKTWLSIPRSAKRFIGFESVHSTPLDFDLVEVTTVRFRLSRNGTEQLYWNGSAWVAAGANDWNTEAEVAANIASLQLTASARGLQVIINLETSTATLSPKVYAVKALYDSDIEWLEDLIARSFKPALEAGLRPIAEGMYVSTGATTLTLAVEAAYEIIGIDAVYNTTTDPERLTNIFQSFNTSTKVVTLTGAPTVGNKILIRFTYKPDVVLVKSQDIVEIAKVPCVQIGDVRSMRAHQINAADHVMNKTTGVGWKLTGGEQIDIEVPLQLITSKEKDAHRMSDEVRAFFKRTPLLTRIGTDDRVRVHVYDEHMSTNVPNIAGMHTARLRIVIMGAVFYASSEEVKGTRSFSVSGDVNFTL